MAISLVAVDSVTEGSVISSPVYDESTTRGSSLLRPKRLICPPSWRLRRLHPSSLARLMPLLCCGPDANSQIGKRFSLRLSTRALRNVRAALLAVSLVGVSCSGAFRSPAAAPHAPTPSAWSKADLTIAYLGRASVLIDFGGTLLLTDPTLYDRIGVALGPITIGPKRI